MRKLSESELRALAKAFDMFLKHYYLEGKSVFVMGTVCFLDMNAEKKNFKTYLDAEGNWKDLFHTASSEGVEFNEKVFNDLFETWWEKGLFN